MDRASHNISGASSGSSGAAKPDSSTNDDIHFRRQHFDRNSILRTSKKRSRKASVNSAGSPAKNPNNSLSASSHSAVAKPTLGDMMNSSATDINAMSSTDEFSKVPTKDVAKTSELPKSERDWRPITVDNRIGKARATESSFDCHGSGGEKRNSRTATTVVHKENMKNLEINFSDVIVKSDQQPHLIPLIGSQGQQPHRHRISSKSATDSNGDWERNYNTSAYPEQNKSKNHHNHNYATNTSFENKPKINLSFGGHQKTTVIDSNDNKEVKGSAGQQYRSASDNVAALLAKDKKLSNVSSTGGAATLSQQTKNTSCAKMNNSNNNKVNGGSRSVGKDTAATIGTSGIRTRREAMRQAEEQKAAESAGKIKAKKHMSNTSKNNNRTTSQQQQWTSSKENEEENGIGGEEDEIEDCGRLI